MASPAVTHSTATAHRCHKGIDKLSPRSTQGANLEQFTSHSRQSSCLSDSSNQFSTMSDTSLFQASSSVMSDNSSFYDRNSSDMFSNSSHSRQASNVSDRSVHSREHSRLSDKSCRHAPSLSDMSCRHAPSLSDMSYSQASCQSDRSSRHSRQSSQLSDYEPQQPFHIRQPSNISDRSSDISRSSNHFRQSSNLSDNGNFPSTLLSSLHQRQSSQLSSVSRNSRESSYDNRAFEPSPRSHRREASYDMPPHSRQSSLDLAHLSGHSRQSSCDHPPASMQPPLIFEGTRAYNQHSSPTPPAFKLPPSYHKFSPISQDQGYHTMVGPHSSPEISPGASLDLSSLHLPCPKGVVRPRPPDVPPSIQLDHRTMTASYKSLSTHSSKQGFLDLLPDDLILGILKQLDSVSLVSCGQVCRRLYHLVWEPVLWTTVTLTGDTIDADLAVKSILSLLAKDSRKPSRCLSVTALHLSCCTRLSDAGLGVIARKCPALTYLDIRACKLVTNAGLAEVVARCSRLQHLDLTGSK